MIGRISIHLPWLAALVILTVVAFMEVIFSRPREAEVAREAAEESIRTRLARDLSLIESAVYDDSLQQVREFVSASSAISGLEETILLDPKGIVLAASDIALEGNPLPDSEAYAPMRRHAAGNVVMEIIREPGSNLVETWASVGFPNPAGGLRAQLYGLLYTRYNIEPTLAPMLESTRSFALKLVLVLILTTVPLQALVYWLVTRRLQRLAEDARAFGQGVRKGLFNDGMSDQIGTISTLLREATMEVGEREVVAHRLELALESANAGIWDWDIPSNTITTNAQYHIMLGDEPIVGALDAEELLKRAHPDDVSMIRTMIRKVVNQEVSLYNLDFRARGLKDGKYRWIRSTGRVVTWGPDGRAIRMLGQHIDISVQKAMQAHEADLARIVDDSPSELYIYTTDTHQILSVNRSAVRNSGYSAGELQSLTIADLTPPADQRALEESLETLRRRDSMYLRRTGKLQRKDGTVYEVETIIQLLSFNEQPAFVAIAQDVSDRVLLQRRFQKLFDGVAHVIMVFDRDVRFIMANEIASQLLRVPADELTGRTLEEFVPDLHALLKERVGSVLDTRAVLEFDDKILIGGIQHGFHSILQTLENDGGQLEWVQLIAYDTTDKLESEARIRAQQERYRALVESTSAILWEGDPETFAFTFVNREAEKVLGYPASAWVNEPGFWQNHIHPLDREQAVATCRSLIEEGEESTFEYRMVAADGRVVWLRDIVKVIREDRRPIKLVGVMIDISREKHEEERFQAAFESIPIGNIVIDAQGRIQLVNPAAQEMFGYAPGELIGQNVAILIPEPEPAYDDGYLLNNLEEGMPKMLGTAREIRGRRKNGVTFPMRLAFGEIHNAEQRSYVGSAIDLSHVKSLEAQLAQSQKMEAIGQLAGGIAHDFNNLLHVINGFTEIARSALPPDAAVQLELSQIALAGERAAALTGQLLAFSRRQVMKPVTIDTNEVIANMSSMLRRVIGEHIQLEVIANPRLGRVYADQAMIEQVLMNLCVNARDAMKAGGRLVLETENVFISEEYCLDHVWAKPGRYVLISVTDTGNGMDRDTMEHIFEPFFTTKGMHEGTGLGLSMVYGIVKQHSGMISVYSEVNKGTTFKVYLPHSERAAEHVGSKIEGEVPHGTETILVVEDDEAVRGLTRSVLEAAGYKVIEAGDGREALQHFRKYQGEIQLALLDVVMPGMGGREAYKEMLKINPALKALFASGYSENAIHTNFVLDDGLALLKKPYSRDDLLRAIRRQLDQ